MSVAIQIPAPAQAGEIIEGFRVGDAPWPDYAILVDVREFHVDFVVHEIVGLTDSPPPAGLWLYKCEDKHRPSDGNPFTTEFAKGKWFLSGEVKWDGCSNWNWHTDEVICSKTQAEGIGRLLCHLYGIAKTRCPKWSAETAG